MPQTPTVGQMIDQTQHSAGEVVEGAQQKVGQVVDQAKQQTTSLLEARKEQAADTLYTVAHALRQTSQQLREQEQEQAPVAGLAEQVATQAERGSSYLRGRDLAQIVNETEQLGRAHPLLFTTGALALGVLGARFLKSSRRLQQQNNMTPLLPPAPEPTPSSRSQSAGSEYNTARANDESMHAGSSAYDSADDLTGTVPYAGLTSDSTLHGSGFHAVDETAQQIHAVDKGQ